MFMDTEQPLIRISVRNLVEFILRSGDIDNRAAGADKDAMLLGGKIHRKIQRSMGADYQAEVSLKMKIPCQGFDLSVEGRADGIFRTPSGIVVDEIKGIFKDLEYLKEPEPIHLAQAKCYAYIYAVQQELEELLAEQTLGAEEIHILLIKAQILDIMDDLLQPGGDGEAAAIRDAAEKDVKIADAVL